MGANDLFAADEVLAEGQIDATSSLLTGAEKASGILSHANSSLLNAKAMLALGGD